MPSVCAHGSLRLRVGAAQSNILQPPQQQSHHGLCIRPNQKQQQEQVDVNSYFRAQCNIAMLPASPAHWFRV